MDAIMDAKTLEDVVSAINLASEGHGAPYSGGADMRSAEAMAGQYALDAVTSSDYPDVTEEILCAHMEILERAGARFDFHGAIAAAFEQHRRNQE